MRPTDVVASRFRLLGLAGSGGMGAVFRADDLETGAQVALKVLRDPDPSSLARFLHEAEILGKLEHPHIVRYVGHGLAEASLPYLAMEWLDGEDLGQRLSRGPLSLDETMGIASCIASALALAHAHGVVHRDIKPSNLYLESHDPARVKLIDFGIARFSKNTAPLTLPNTILGTPGYLAPEQASGEEVIGPAADIFALGCVLFECLTGQPAFQGAHPMALFAKLLLETPPRVSDLRAEVSQGLSFLIERMLAKQALARPKDGAALVSAISCLETEMPASQSHAPTSAAPSRIGRSERRHLSIVAIAAPRERPCDANASTVLLSVGGSEGGVTGVRRLVDATRKLAMPLGAEVNMLADGTILVVFVDGNPTEQAARAGRLSLAVQSECVGSSVVLVSGRGDMTDRLPVGELVERAAFLLLRARQLPELGVIADEETEGLLAGRFEISLSNGLLTLLRERAVEQETRTLLGKPSPFVGRERELGNLLEALKESFEERRAHAVIVTAPAGMGKSRLRRELFARLSQRMPSVLLTVGSADSLGQGAAFSLLASWLRNILQVEEGTSLGRRHTAITQAVAAFLAGDSVPRVAAFLGELLDAPFPDEYYARLRMARSNPNAMAAEIQAAFLEFLRAVVTKRPLLLAVEDLHASDSASVKLVDIALRELRDEPFAVVAFGRLSVHESFPRLWAERGAEEIRLGPLARRSSATLVRAVLGQDVAAQQLEQILDRAAGNAFYLEELVRIVKDGRGDELPTTVLGMVEARLLALPPDSRRVLRAASVYGDVFWYGGVLALLGRDRPAHFDQILQDLIDKEIVTLRLSSRYAGEKELCFRHALVREAAFAMLTDRDRVVGHGLAGAWLERTGEKDPALLAMHFERGGLFARASAQYARAAERAMQGQDLVAALQAVERGLSRVGLDQRRAAELWALRARIESMAGSGAEALAAAEQAIRLARPGSVAHCLALESALSSAMVLGKTELTEMLTAQLPTVEPDANAVSALARMLTPAAVAFCARGRVRDARPHLDRLRDIMAGRMEQEPSGAGSLCYASACWDHFILRQPYSALLLGQNAIRYLESAAEGYYVSVVRSVIAGSLAALGAYEEASVWLTEALSKVRRGSLVESVGRWNLARLHLEQGNAEEARALTQAVFDGWAKQTENVGAPHARITHVEACIALGDVQGAECSLGILDEMAEAAPIARALSTFGEAKLRLSQGEPHWAAELAAMTLEACRSIEVEPTEQMLAVQVEALVRAGERGRASAAIRVAEAEIRRRSELIAEQVYRASFLKRVRAVSEILSFAEGSA